MLICGIFFIPETFAEGINFKPYQESMILLVDQPKQKSQLTITLMSKSNEDFMISDQLEEKIKNTNGLVSISITNMDDCVMGVSNQTCILISFSRNNIQNQKEFDSVQEGTREIANTLIDDIFHLFPIVQKYGIPIDNTPKLHSVFLHSGGQFLAE